MTIRLFPITGSIALLLAGSFTAFSYPECPARANPGMLGSGGGNATEQTWNIVAPRPFLGPPITGAPYSEQLNQSGVTLAANGAHLGGQAFALPMMYRDSLGRTRTDQMSRPFGMSGQTRVNQLARVEDPVAGYEYVLDSFHQIAYRLPFCTFTPQQVQEAEHPGGGPPPNRSTSSVTDEDLGTQTMFGVAVSGVRTTTSWPPGSYQNNDVTVTRTDEEWTSKQYGKFVSKRTDPQRESSTTMTSFSDAEPDPSLFQIPAGYQIVDETAPFTITIHYDSK